MIQRYISLDTSSVLALASLSVPSVPSIAYYQRQTHRGHAKPTSLDAKASSHPYKASPPPFQELPLPSQLVFSP